MDINRPKTLKLIKSLEKKCNQDNVQIDKLDKGMTMTFKDNNLPVAHAFIGRHNKADYFHILFWFSHRHALVRMAKKHSEPKDKVKQLQVLAYRQFKAVQKPLYQKMCIKQDRDHNSQFATSLKLLLKHKKLTVMQENSLDHSYQLAYEGFPLDKQSQKDLDKQIKADDVHYPRLRKLSWWPEVKFHYYLAHYPVKLVAKVIKVERSYHDDYSKYQADVKQLLKGRFSFDRPKSNVQSVDLSTYHTVTNHIKQTSYAVQGSLF